MAAPTKQSRRTREAGSPGQCDASGARWGRRSSGSAFRGCSTTASARSARTSRRAPRLNASNLAAGIGRRASPSAVAIARAATDEARWTSPIPFSGRNTLCSLVWGSFRRTRHGVRKTTPSDSAPRSSRIRRRASARSVTGRSRDCARTAKRARALPTPAPRRVHRPRAPASRNPSIRVATAATGRWPQTLTRRLKRGGTRPGPDGPRGARPTGGAGVRGLRTGWWGRKRMPYSQSFGLRQTASPNPWLHRRDHRHARRRSRGQATLRRRLRGGPRRGPNPARNGSWKSDSASLRVNRRMGRSNAGSARMRSISSLRPGIVSSRSRRSYAGGAERSKA